jgi:hypothetical protein
MVFVDRHGRLVKFQNRQARHPCGKRRKGRPRGGYGACHSLNKNPVRQERKRFRARFRALDPRDL